MKHWLLLILTASAGLAACAGSEPRPAGGSVVSAPARANANAAIVEVGDDPAPALQAAARTEGTEDDGVICRRVEVTGSHRRVRVCTTREERETMRQQSQEVLRDTLFERAGPGSPEGAN